MDNKLKLLVNMNNFSFHKVKLSWMNFFSLSNPPFILTELLLSKDH